MFRLVKIVLLTFGVIIVATSGAVYSARQGNVYRCILTQDGTLFDISTGSFINKHVEAETSVAGIEIVRDAPDKSYQLVQTERALESRHWQDIYFRPVNAPDIKLAEVERVDQSFVSMRLASSWMALATLSESVGDDKPRHMVIRIFDAAGRLQRTVTLPDQLYPVPPLFVDTPFIYQTADDYTVVTLPDLDVYQIPRNERYARQWIANDDGNQVALVERGVKTSETVFRVIWPKEKRNISIPLSNTVQEPSYMEWSPDGTRLILYYKTVTAGRGVLIINVKQLHDNSLPELNKAIMHSIEIPQGFPVIWSPDSRSVYYFQVSSLTHYAGHLPVQGFLRDFYEYEIARYRLDTGTSETVIQHIVRVESPTFYPSIFVLFVRDHNDQLRLMVLDAAGLHPIASHIARINSVMWKRPDPHIYSDWVEVTWAIDNQLENNQTALVNLKTMQVTKLPGYTLELYWDRAGKSIVRLAHSEVGQSLMHFETETQQIQYLLDGKDTIIVHDKPSSLFALWNDGDKSWKLEQWNWNGKRIGTYSIRSKVIYGTNIDLSPDRAYAVLWSLDTNGQHVLELIPLDGRPSLLIRTGQNNLSSLTWSPDSQRFAFRQIDPAGVASLQVISVDGSLIQQWEPTSLAEIQWTRCD